AYGEGSSPVITGWRQSDNWEKVGGGVFKMKLDESSPKINMVLIDGVPQEMGRFPNEGYLTYTATQDNNVIESQETFGHKDFSNASIAIRKSQWIIDRHDIISIEGNKINFAGDSG